jgi:hypothetical protein
MVSITRKANIGHWFQYARKTGRSSGGFEEMHFATN